MGSSMYMDSLFLFNKEFKFHYRFHVIFDYINDPWRQYFNINVLSLIVIGVTFFSQSSMKLKWVVYQLSHIHVIPISPVAIFSRKSTLSSVSSIDNLFYQYNFIVTGDTDGFHNDNLQYQMTVKLASWKLWFQWVLEYGPKFLSLHYKACPIHLNVSFSHLFSLFLYVRVLISFLFKSTILGTNAFYPTLFDILESVLLSAFRIILTTFNVLLKTPSLYFLQQSLCNYMYLQCILLFRSHLSVGS